MGIEAAILGGAGIGAVGSILGGREARKGAQAGANTQYQMHLDQMQLYRDQIERNEPFRKIGLAALQDYQNQLKTPLQFDPTYGIKQLDSSAAARGLYGSTGHLSRIADYATRGKYDAQSAHLNRLAALAGLGQTATNSMGNTTANMGSLSQATANNLSNLQQAQGNARASTYMGLANTANNALSQYMYGRGMGLFQPTNPMAGYQPGMGYTPQQYVTGNY